VDHDIGSRREDSAAHPVRVEDIENSRDYAGLRKLLRFAGGARSAGDLVAGAEQKRHQAPTDRARGTGEKYSHDPMLSGRIARRRA